MSTLWDLLESAAARYGPKAALIAKRGHLVDRWSYAYLRDASERTACLLGRLGLAKGDRLVIWAPNMPEWVALYFGCLRAGMVPVPLDVRGSAEQALRIAGHAGARGAFVARGLTGAFSALGIPVWHIEELTRQLEGIPADPGLPRPGAGDLAELVFTSGTTGEPKGVMLTHGNILANVTAATKVIPCKPGYRLLSLLPLSHMLEQNGGLLGPLTGGATVVYPASRSPAAILRTLRDSEITHMVVVPQILQVFWSAIERAAARQGRQAAWRRGLRIAPYVPMPVRRALFGPVHRSLGGHFQFFICGGAYLDPALALKWECLGIPVVEGYGTTEAAPIVAVNAVRGRRLGTVGRPLPGEEVKIVPDGEILIRGPNVTPGYWSNPKADAEAFEGGWFKTGDLGYLDKKGFLHLRGRKMDRIVLASGLNVYPQDVEDVLKAQPGVRDACVVGVPGRRGQVQVHAALLLRETAPEPGRIVEEGNRHLAEHQRIQGHTVWPYSDFPRTPTLKVRAQEVAAYIQKGTPPVSREVPAAAPPVEGATVVRLVAEVAEMAPGQVAPGMALGEGLQLDSLGRVELLSVLETELGVCLDESQVLAGTTVQQLEELVAKAEPVPEERAPSRWTLQPGVRVLRAVIQSVVVFPALRLVMPATVEGLEHVRGLRGPVLLAANHTSHLDTPAVLAALPVRPRFQVAVAAAAGVLAERGAFSRWFASFAFNAFPFSQTDSIRATLDYSSWLLDKGWSILIYPEGRRSENGTMGPFKPGVGFMAVSLGVPVVPVHIEGAHRVLPKGRRIPGRSRISVRFGAPLVFSRASAYPEATAAVQEAVKALGAGGRRGR